MAKKKDTAKESKKSSKSNKKTTKKIGKKGSYKASDITVLEGLDPVRKRPGMYIGTTGPDGLHHLINEVFDNAKDEAMAEYADRIEVALLPGNKVRVVDNGRGIPVDKHKQTGKSALETIMTTLHAGGKFGGEGYKVSGGLHGVGVSVVNALSSSAYVEVHRDGGQYVQEYERGVAKSKVKKVGKSDSTGTIVIFEPDPEIFKEIIFNWEKIVNYLRQQAYLTRSTKITAIDAREYEGKIDADKAYWLGDLPLEVPSMTFYFEGGIVSMVKFHNHGQKPVHSNIFYVEKEHEDPNVETVEIALQYVDDISSRILPFANNIANPEGGMHLTGFKTALTRSLNSYARNNNILKENDDNFAGDDVLEGLTAVVSIKMREVQFEGQTKAKLGNTEARSAVENIFGDSFNQFLEENPDDARSIIGKAILALRARKAAKAAKDSVLRKGALEGLTLPGKLADCQTRKAEESELFIVEGDSAGGCFSGDTKIALVDGRNLSLRDLVSEDRMGKKNYCYTIDDEQNIQIAPIKDPRVTKKNTSVIKVVLDNDEEITCTPDHKFMLRDGSYKKAKDLTTHDSLMPLRRQLSRIGKRITIKGYEMVYSPGSSRWIFTHLLSDEFNVRKGLYRSKNKKEVLHHMDFNKRNNNPGNITRMNKEEHLMFHTRNLDKTLYSEESKERARRAHQKPEYKEKIRKIMTTPEMRKMLSDRAKKQWEDEEYKKFMNEKYLEFYNSNAEYRRELKKRLNKEQKKYWSDSRNVKAQSRRVSRFFEENPDRREELSELAKSQWNNSELRAWRAEETKMQWTNDFRKKRKDAYNKTYLNKGLKTLHSVYKEQGEIDYNRYNELRKELNDKSIIRHDTLVERFFGGEIEKLEEAVVNYNHRIKKIVRLDERIDVYDFEVPKTHNFALSSGVFVHNSSKQGRDRRTQAILPLRGKILNVERARLDKMLASKEIKHLVVALGTAIGDTFDISKLRYHKIIIATDADVDGAHIRTLILTLFFRYFRDIIEGGFLYIAKPPLYKISVGKEDHYLYTEDEKEKFLKNLGFEPDAESDSDVEKEEGGDDDDDEDKEETAEDVARKSKKISIQRYKGLGEMNPDELWDTTMNPETRVLKQVRIDDAEDADRTFDILMGTDVPARKSFIQSNAKMAEIDI